MISLSYERQGEKQVLQSSHDLSHELTERDLRRGAAADEHENKQILTITDSMSVSELTTTMSACVSKNFKCSSCDYKTSRPCHLIEHVRVKHTRTNLIPCKKEGCNFMAVTHSRLQRHTRLRQVTLAVNADAAACLLLLLTLYSCKPFIERAKRALNLNSGKNFLCHICTQTA